MSDTIKALTKKDGETKDLVATNVERLKELFPEIVTEGKVDFEALKEVLGDFSENSPERYSFNWNGKSQARKIAMTPSMGTLRPAPEESVNWDTTENVFIEGDNLEVLKLLQRSYHKKIKMIYIDPPYNTGNDFVYNDDFKDNLSNYLKITGQKDGEGNKITSNPETSGRYHTDWLNMMYPRLILSRELLKDDGVIFISNDDNENANLKKVCDEVFGEENFIAKYVHKNNSIKNQAKLVSISTEYIFCYAKNKDILKESTWRISKNGSKEIARLHSKLINQGLSLDEVESEIKDMYKRPKYSHLSRWNKVDKKGVFKDSDLSREGGAKDYTIINPNTGKKCIIPNRGWGKTKEELEELQKNDLIWYGADDTPPGMKDYINEDDVRVPDNFWYYDNSVDTRWIKKSFGGLVFQNPKPKEMIKTMIQMVNLESGDIIMDYFAGSGTTAHSILESNIESDIDLKFILVQLPERLDSENKEDKAAIKYLRNKSMPLKLSEVTKERVRLAIKENVGKLEKNNVKLNNKIGFKVFKLDASNIKPWDASFEDVQLSLEDSIENVKSDRSEEDVLYEILLKYGLDLTLPIEEKEIAGAKVFVGGAGALVLCLSANITTEVVEGIAQLNEELQPEFMRVVFRDSGFKDDVVKTNAVQILKQHGIEDMRSI